ncbi:MAG TPA: GAF domain-containing sensor histidine kinase [Solirubrobacteraceae bacterium]|nr:GAF domain-containing sensor histidine kinase [Solirubrobacteraceae bacterium]
MNTEAATLRHLMEVGRQLLSQLDPDTVFTQVLDEARLITGARYAAIGVLDAERGGLERFLTDGLDSDAASAIGDLPRGRGVLRLLIEDPRALRLADVNSHPQSFGFPFGHPDMKTFLGVPILIRGEAWGNLYLTEKAFGLEFTEADEEAVGVLAQFAATAIDNARMYQQAEQGRRASQQAVRGLEAARAISDAIGAQVELETILELTVKRGRALVGARSVLILLAEGDEVVLVAGTGVRPGAVGTREPLVGSIVAESLAGGTPLRAEAIPERLDHIREQLGVADARTALVVPMIHHGHSIGVLIALDRGSAQEPFSAADEEVMRTFASSAANAVAISRSVEADRLRAQISAAEKERRRWARELHDQTLQSLGGLRVMLAGARRRDELEGFRHAVNQAVSDLESEIQNLRGIISDLRPALLDDLGLVDALGALVSRHRENGLAATLEIDLDGPDGPLALSEETETTVYRLIQEALTNVVKHAKASGVAVRVGLGEGPRLRLEVRDDGIGFDPDSRSGGFGLAGIRERVYLAGGLIAISSGPQGTTVRAEVPVGVHAPLG